MGAQGPIRKLPLVVALLVVIAASVFYLVFYRRQLQYIVGRNARLLVVAERALLSATEGGAGLQRTVVRKDGVLLVVTEGGDARWKEWQQALEYPVVLRDVLESIPLGRDAFDAILVTDEKAAVVDQIGDATLSRLSLEGLGAAGAPLTAEMLWRGNTVSQTNINGEDHRLFCHPVRLAHWVDMSGPGSPREGVSGAGFIFCGVVTERRLTRQAMSISPQTLAALIALLALTFLTPPFIKLALLGRRERFRFSDAYALAMCTFLGLLILSIAVTDVSLVWSLQARGDAGLRALAETVAANLTGELRDVEKQARHFDDLLVARGARSSLCLDVLGLGTAPSGEADPSCPPPAGVDRLPDSEVESVAWLTADGKQEIKWSSLPNPRARRLKVDTREYFTAVRDGHLWPSASGLPTDGASGRFVQAVQSWSAGQSRAVLSVPSRARLADGEPLTAVTAALNLRSVTNPVVPPWTGFCIIDGQGAILFHSDAKQALTHNLFEETVEDLDLRSAVMAGVPDITSGRYWGERHRFYVLPLHGTPWSVVAFRNEDLLRAVNLEILEDAAGLALLYVVISFAVPSLVCVFLLRRRLDWLWPGAGRGLVYAEMVASFATAAVLLLLALEGSDPARAVEIGYSAPWAILVAFVLPFALGRMAWRQSWAIAVAAGGTFALLCFSVAFGRPDTASTLCLETMAFTIVWVAIFRLGVVIEARTRCETWLERAARGYYLVPHLVATLLFWALYAVLPGVAVMKAGTDIVLRGLVRYEQVWYAGELETRGRRLQTFYGHRLDPVTQRALIDQRWSDDRDVYTSGIFPVTRLPPLAAPPSAAPTTAGWLAEILQDAHAHKPLLHPASVPLRHLGLGAAGYRAWTVSQGVGRSREYFLATIDGGRRAALLSADLPSFRDWTVRWPLLIPAVLVLAILAYWVHWSARHIFLAELGTPATVDLQQLREELGAHAICLVPSSFEIARALEGGWCQRLGTPPTVLPGTEVVVVDRLDLLSLAASDRVALLDVLEPLLRDGVRRVCVLASSNPAEALMAPVSWPPDDPRSWKRGEPERWASLLAAFKVVLLRERRRRRRDGEVVAPEDVVRHVLGLEPSQPLTREGALVMKEIGACPDLADRARERIAHGAFATLGRDEILRQLADLGWAYYFALWTACSPDEKLTLVQLCEEGFVNHRQEESIRSLLRRGLAVRDPILLPMNESFGLFVRTIRNPDEVAQVESSPGGFGWSEMKLPLASIAVSCAVLLFVSHRDLVDSTVVFVSALGASGIPMLSKLANAVKTLAQVGARPGSERA